MTTEIKNGQSDAAASAPDLSELAGHLVAAARSSGVELTGPGGLLTGLTKQVLETALDVELTEHLGHGRHHDPAVAMSGMRQPQDGPHRCRGRADHGAAGSCRHVHPGGRAEALPAPGGVRRRGAQSVCEGHDDRRHREPPGRRLWHRGLWRPGVSGDRRGRRADAAVAEPAAGHDLPGTADRRYRAQDP